MRGHHVSQEKNYFSHGFLRGFTLAVLVTEVVSSDSEVGTSFTTVLVVSMLVIGVDAKRLGEGEASEESVESVDGVEGMIVEEDDADTTEVAVRRAEEEEEEEAEAAVSQGFRRGIEIGTSDERLLLEEIDSSSACFVFSSFPLVCLSSTFSSFSSFSSFSHGFLGLELLEEVATTVVDFAVVVSSAFA